MYCLKRFSSCFGAGRDYHWLMAKTRREIVLGPSAVARKSGVCNFLHMPTNLAIDDRLLNEALRVGGHRTKKATVTEALEEYIQRRKQLGILELFGKLDFHRDFEREYKRARHRR